MSEKNQASLVLNSEVETNKREFIAVLFVNADGKNGQSQFAFVPPFNGLESKIARIMNIIGGRSAMIVSDESSGSKTVEVRKVRGEGLEASIRTGTKRMIYDSFDEAMTDNYGIVESDGETDGEPIETE